MSVPADVLDLLMGLDQGTRAELAHHLIRSLDPEGSERDPDWESAWAAEVERRSDDVAAGRTTLIPWEEVRDRIRSSLRATRSS